MYILETKALTKTYREANALQGIDLALEPGKIYGLVGNNGAGKTTLFRILGGLARPTSGSVSLFGAATKKGLNRARKRIGFLIESPVYYPTLSARSNLRNVQLLCGGEDKDELRRVLEQVGLNPDSHQPLRHYSTGMKQRYGLAAALVGDPELLVLDEPLNGLDPQGALDMNKLLLRLRDQGKTILLSSHLLAQLYKTATDYLFLDHGRVLEQITHAELDERCGFQLTVRSEDLRQAARALEETRPDLEMIVEEDCIRLVHCAATAGEITGTLRNRRITAAVETSGISLEDYFLALAGDRP